jgi:ABC-type sulfate transport system substrate-binding protein
MDKSGRESVTTFERGVGDVIVTYENELLPRIKQGRPYELIFPAETVVVENPIAVIDRNADRHHVRDLADAFVSFLNGEEAQQAFVEFGFRPANEAVAKASASAFRPSTACIYDRRSRRMGSGLRRTVQSARSLDESGGGNTIAADCPTIRNAWRAHAPV